jgi:hypothetical protein
MDIPMLEEHEWELLEPHLTDAVQQIKRYRELHGVSLSEAQAKGYGQDALALYRRFTGFDETNANALWHHRLSLYGPPCAVFDKPLRTPAAKHCAECGEPRRAAR